MRKLRKIAFILPRGAVYRYKKGAFKVFIRYAPLTLPMLVALIPQDMNIKVEIYDEGVEVINKEKIDADLIAITSITGASQRAYAYADYFRNKGIPVVMGGVHATLCTEEAMQHADAVVSGIAVETWPQLLRDFEAGQMKKIYTRPENVNFAGWPLPARNCYSDKKLRFISINSVQATYGCPNKCEFCVTPYSCSGYNHRPIEEVVDEIRQIKEKNIIFVDPSPIEDDYAKELYRAMIPLKKNWVSPTTIRLAQDDELLDVAARSGCKGTLIGFESVSDTALKNIRKGFNAPDSYYTAVQNLHSKGIGVMGCFVFGLDSDDKGVFQRTLEFVNKANIDIPRFTVNTAYPGTPFYDRMKAEGRLIEDDWSMYDCQHVVVKPKLMTAEELQVGHHWAWKQAYNPGSIIKRLSGSRTFLSMAILTNIAYHIYSRNLPKYTRDVMTDYSDITGVKK